jgi:ribonuclease J
VVNKHEIGRTFIDDSGFEEIDGETVRQRKQMAYEGIITLIVTIDSDTGELEAQPEIVARGVRGFEESDGLMQEARQIVAASIAGASRETMRDESLLKEHIRVELKRFIQKLTGSKPVILPVVIQV